MNDELNHSGAGRRRARRERRAFSLIELLIVIAILLAIGGLVVVNLLPAKDQADIDLTRVQLDQFDAALKRFKLDLKRWPTEDEGIAALWSRDAIQDEEEQKSWRGPYLEKPMPKDTWGAEWTYRVPSELVDGGPYDLVSHGPDGEEQSEDDIHNHARETVTAGGDGGTTDDFAPPRGE